MKAAFLAMFIRCCRAHIKATAVSLLTPRGLVKWRGLSFLKPTIPPPHCRQLLPREPIGTAVYKAISGPASSHLR
jgi:hypothetical protein